MISRETEFSREALSWNSMAQFHVTRALLHRSREIECPSFENFSTSYRSIRDNFDFIAVRNGRFQIKNQMHVKY